MKKISKQLGTLLVACLLGTGSTFALPTDISMPIEETSIVLPPPPRIAKVTLTDNGDGTTDMKFNYHAPKYLTQAQFDQLRARWSADPALNQHLISVSFTETTQTVVLVFQNAAMSQAGYTDSVFSRFGFSGGYALIGQ